ncbi:MAG: IPT/TIG domain-containing protein, partial [Promethearchaeia archaeon]
MIGSNFTGSFSHVSSGHTFCRWGPTGALVKPSFVSGTRIICASPPSSSVNPTMVTVHVTNDGGYTFSTDVLTFSYETQEHVASLEPSAGPETGNTLVRVHGQGFRRLNLLSCRFGSVIVSAAWVSDTMVECMSQPTPAGTNVDVRVANNGHDFSTSSAVYMYTALVTISSHLPTGVLSEGGSAVAISGTGFLDLSTLICKFGIKVVPATFQTSTLVTCTAPFLDVGSFTLQVSNNGRDFATGKNPIKSLLPAEFHSIFPPSGPESGSTLVHVYGANFYDAGVPVRCQFGALTLVEATMVNETHLACLSPPFSGVRSVALLLSFDNQSFTPTLQMFRYEPVAYLIRLEPSTGPQFGGTAVTAIGTSIQNSGHSACRFTSGEVSRRSQSVRWLSHSSIICFLPNLLIGSYQVQLSSNSVDFNPDRLSFLVAPLPAV